MQSYDFNEILETHIGLLEKGTADHYLWERDLLLKFCRRRNKEPFELDVVDCLAWAKWRLSRPGHSSRFQLGKLQTVSSYTVFAAAIRWRAVWRRGIDLGVVTGNPWQAVRDSLRRRARACQKRPTEAMSDEEVRRLLNSCNIGTKNGRKDHCFFCLLFGGALRLNEAATITLENIIQNEEGIFQVILPKTKSGFLQTQLLPEWCSESIARLINQRKEEGAHKPDSLFVVYRGKHETLYNRQYTHEAWRKRWELYRARLGLSVNYTPHSGRASACTKLLTLGVDRKEVQDFMRHQTLRMVEIYDKRRFFGKNHASKKLSF